MRDSGEGGMTRRGAIRSLVGGSLLMPGILAQLLADERKDDPLFPRAPHFPARARRVILLYMTGGVSHVDTFDEKPALIAAAGRTVAKAGAPPLAGGPPPRSTRKLLGPAWPFRPGGRSGTRVSDLFPHVRRCMDEICLVRSMKSDHNEHVQATLGIHTGSFTFPRPSLGSWVSYGLGTFNRNLPSFVVIAPHLPYAGVRVITHDFLPAVHQATRVVPGPEPIRDLERGATPPETQERELELARLLDRKHLEARGSDAALAARIRSFETAFRMQFEAPEAFDLSAESDATLALYGLARGQTEGFAWQCLAARRLAERGVRFIELVDVGSAHNWDAHGGLKGSYEKLARNVDQPIAALLRDLKARGMLEETLVVWTTEFGRSPHVDPLGTDGRTHHAACFSSWLAGGGVKGGMAHGATDDLGDAVAEGEVHVHDFHATILHLLGLDHERLTFRHAGRDFRLTDVHGRVVRELLA
jgi:hypothetical protein